MRTLLLPISIGLLLTHAAGARASGSPNRLESVSILPAGAGASLAVRSSHEAALVATTAADTRTAVIELVGVAADRRDMAVTGAAGLISHVAIETSGAEPNAVTRIRVTLADPYRHRLRISGKLVYVDFERSPAPPAATTPAAVRPAPPPLTPAARSTRAAASPPAPAPSRATPAPAATPSLAAFKAESGPAPARSPLADITNVLAALKHAPAPPASNAAPLRAWLPLVLKDGGVIYSYGDYAQVGDQLMFLLPFDDADSPRSEAVSVPAAAFDLEATRRAIQTARADRYAASAGPREYAALTREVAGLITRLQTERSAEARLGLAESARRLLVDWPAQHHGYRADDIGRAVLALDPIITHLRAATGSAARPAGAGDASRAQGKRQSPTLADLLDSALRIVPLLTVPAERTSVLRAASDAMDRHRASLPAEWVADGRRRTQQALGSETHVDEEYRTLTAGILARASRAAREGDVRTIAALKSELLERDEELGRRRPDLIIGTMGQLQTQYEEAARIQIQRDRRAPMRGAP